VDGIDTSTAVDSGEQCLARAAAVPLPADGIDASSADPRLDSIAMEAEATQPEDDSQKMLDCEFHDQVLELPPSLGDLNKIAVAALRSCQINRCQTVCD